MSTAGGDDDNAHRIATEAPHGHANSQAAPAAVPAEPKKVKPPRKKKKKTNPDGSEDPIAKNKKEPFESPNRQKQRDKEFAEHKQHILNNLQQNACDLSPKGSVDKKCLPVMEVLNGSPDYITTSSCSGRIALFHSMSEAEGGFGGGAEEAVVGNRGAATLGNDSITSASTRGGRGMKRGAQEALGWLFVKHGVLTAAEMQLLVLGLCGDPLTPEEAALDDTQMMRWLARQTEVEREEMVALDAAEGRVVRAGAFAGEVEGPFARPAPDATTPLFPLPPRGTICLKMEPFVMHVECRTMTASKELLTAAATEGGYRNSGVTPPGKKIMCGIRCTTGLGMEIPLVMNGHNYMQRVPAKGGAAAASGTNPNRMYLWDLLDLANEKMLANEKRIDRLERAVKNRVKQT